MPISIPKFFQRAFAQNGGKQDVPITGDNSGGRASYDVGFPPVTRIPIVAGGIPPFGTDFNGVLYDLSQAIQYVQSGVAFPFDQDFATAIGGYEIGAIVSDASNKSLLWINGTANNTAFPSGWTSFKLSDPTETVRGMPLVATAAEARSMTNREKMLTPGGLNDAFTGGRQSLGDNGFQRLPGGLIRQWGYTSVPASGLVTVQLPIPFPNNCISAMTCDSDSNPATLHYGGVGVLGASSVQLVYAKGGAGSAAGRVQWEALGY